MKTLYMVRHAKSSWEFDVSDRERPLNKRGLRDAEAMSLHLSNAIERPDLMLSSPANRAHTTALFFKTTFDMPDAQFREEEALYDFGGSGVMDVIKSCPETVNSLMIFGHNHAFTSIANMLGNRYIDNVPTCGFVHIQAAVKTWKDFANGTTKFMLFPKELR